MKVDSLLNAVKEVEMISGSEGFTYYLEKISGYIFGDLLLYMNFFNFM